jgi:hypothetical protein
MPHRAPPPVPQDFGLVLSAAASVGLGYRQHILAVSADTDIDGDAFVYYISDEKLLALTLAPHRRGPVARVPTCWCLARSYERLDRRTPW